MSDGERREDYEGADSETLELILSESDKRITAQVQLMLANDARANGILAAAATLAAGALAVAGTQLGKDGDPQLLAGSVAFAAVAILATIAALWALWPKGVDAQGWSPRLFVVDIAAKKSFTQIKTEIAAFNQTKIRENEECNKSLSDRVKIAMSLLALSAPVGGLVLLVSSICVHH